VKVSTTSGARRGSTLILVLIVGFVMALVVFTTAGLAGTSSQRNVVERSAADMRYRCEAAGEMLRLEVVNHYEDSGLPASSWIGGLIEDHDGDADFTDWNTLTSGNVAAGPPGSMNVGVQTYATADDVRAWIDRVDPDGWIEVVAATNADVGVNAHDERAPVSVRMRLNIGTNQIFDLAFLTVTTNCMFCHFEISGDAGSIGFFRPGWGSENVNGHDSGDHSEISGSIYIGDRASDDTDSAPDDDVLDPGETEINGTDVAGDIFEFYNGPKLPEDTIGDDGVPDFPSIDPAEAQARATNGDGSIWAGAGATAPAYAPNTAGIWIVPPGGDWDNGGGPGSGAVPADQATLDSVIDGNVVIVGTDADPITIAGNIFATGDVIVKGKVDGQGALYAGRNVYVAGDIRYADQPTSGYPLQDDAEGSAAVGEKVSELRLAARSNIVIGDWTYVDPEEPYTDANSNGQWDPGEPYTDWNQDGAFDDGTDISRMRDRQAQDFMKAQFDLNDVRYYEADASGSTIANELTKDGSKFYNDLGKVVPAANVATVDDGTTVGSEIGDFRKTRYDATIAPGNVIRQADGSGSFDPWMNDAGYQEILGTEQLSMVSYRLPGIGGASDAAKEYEYGEGWAAANGTDKNLLDRDAIDGQTGQYVFNDGRRIVEVNDNLGDDTIRVNTQVRHIDAFLYANKRIGGKIDEGHLTVNGGMAAGEIGVLAPGLKREWWYKSNPPGDNWPSWFFDYLSPGDGSHPTNDYGEPMAKTRLHYDYRLRNGGFGFEFFAKTGDVLSYARGGQANPPAGF